MLEGVYSAASGLDGYVRNQEVIASNLANVNTVGYKKSFIDFKTVLESINTENPEEKVENVKTEVGIDFTSGSLEHTDNSLDMAIIGDGFFTIETEDGQRYTRNGHFQISGNGEIVTLAGGRLLGAGGPVLLPQGAVEIKVDSSGTLKADDSVMDDLLITTFKRRDLLAPTGNSLFAAPLEAGIEQDLGSNVRQGYLEKSNVDVVMEMVQMIHNMRSFEAGNRTIKALGDSIEKLIRSQG